MDFIQCKDVNDAEAQMKTTKAAFVSSDHRVYEDIEFWDEFSVWHINAKTLLQLYNLQSQIENMLDGGNEMPFDGIVEQAKELQDEFKKVVKAIGYKPIHKKQRS